MDVNRAGRGADPSARKPSPLTAAGRAAVVVAVVAAASAAAVLSLLSLDGTGAAFTVRATTPPIEAVAPTPTVSATPSASPSPLPPAATPSPTPPQQQEDTSSGPIPEEPAGQNPQEGGQDRPPHSPHGGPSVPGPDTTSTARDPRGGGLEQE